MNLRRFQKVVYSYYHTRGRDFPWRRTHDPYKILVSEVMLQQTQTHRVLPKFGEFLKLFPDIAVLERAPLKKVLAVWQGLGYNRRALFLKQCAGEIVKKYNGEIPDDVSRLTKLPGIGPNTAGAIIAFAYGKPVVFIETNIRSVFLHRFFKKRRRVPDQQVMPLVAHTLDRNNPREWYWALMDYGAMLKKTFSNPSRKSANHQRQSPFRGSERELRGKIVRELIFKNTLSLPQLKKNIGIDEKRLNKILTKLIKEKLIHKTKNTFSIED